MATKEKNIWILMLFILCGVVLGGLIGKLVSQVDFLWWVGYGETFGLTTPITLELGVISVAFGLTFNINVASILGIIIALFVYKKM